MIAPQHGAIYTGESVAAFLDWLSNLRCGIDLLDQTLVSKRRYA